MVPVSDRIQPCILWETQEVKSNKAVQEIDVPALQKILTNEGAVFEQGLEHQARGLAAIKRLYPAPPRKGPAPWARPEK